MTIQDRMVRGGPVLHALAEAGILFHDFKNLIGSGGSAYAGGGTYEAAGISFGTKSAPISVMANGGHAGLRLHVNQDKLMSNAADILSGIFMRVSHGNVVSTAGNLEGVSAFVRNPGTGTLAGSMIGGLFMIYCATGSQAKYKKGLLVDVLDMASTHPAGGGTQGILVQLNPTSIVNNQVDAILINQNSAQTIFSGITFKGKIGAVSGNGAVINFIGAGDAADAEGNKPQLFKFRSGGASYIVTPAQFLSALGGNVTSI